MSIRSCLTRRRRAARRRTLLRMHAVIFSRPISTYLFHRHLTNPAIFFQFYFILKSFNIFAEVSLSWILSLSSRQGTSRALQTLKSYLPSIHRLQRRGGSSITIPNCEQRRYIFCDCPMIATRDHFIPHSADTVRFHQK